MFTIVYTFPRKEYFCKPTDPVLDLLYFVATRAPLNNGLFRAQESMTSGLLADKFPQCCRYLPASASAVSTVAAFNLRWR